MSFLLLTAFFLLLCYILAKWKWANSTGIKSFTLVILFGINVLAGFALVYLYSSYYDKSTSDIFLYFNDAIYLKNLFLNDREIFWDIILNQNINTPTFAEKILPLEYWSSPKVDFLIHEKRFIILLNFIFSFISLDQIYIHSMLMAFIGFIGQIAIFRFVKQQTSIDPTLILIISFLTPTFLLWSSTVLKEPLIIFSLGLVLYHTGKWIQKRQSRHLIYSIAFFALSLLIKPYVILCLIFPLLIFIVFSKKTQFTFKQQSLIIFISIVFITFLFWSFTFWGFNIFEKLSQKQNAFYQTIAIAEEANKVGSQIKINKLEPNLASLLLNAPKAFANVMFRPGLLEYKNLLYLPDIIQNLLLLVIGFLLPARYVKPSRKQYPFLWLSVLFIITLFTTIGLVTPVLGAIVRYKIPALIFVFFLLLSFLRFPFKLEKLHSIFFSRNSFD